MPKAYWIGRITVTDPAMYPKYIEAGAKALANYNTRFLVRGGKFEPLEGDHRERNIVIEFDSLELAKACYNSELYQIAAKIRQACSVGEFIVVEGTE